MEGSPCRATAYVAVLAGLVGIALVAGCVARSFSGQETAQSRAAAHRAKAAAGVRGSVREARSLVDVAATPRGWSPVAYQGVQISVPSRWFVENPGTICGQRDQGRVFIAEPVRTLTTLGCGGPAANVVTIRVASTAAVPHAHQARVNGIPVTLGRERVGRRLVHLERGLGLDIGVSGPLARRVLATITHSPLSVVLASPRVPVPAEWRHVSFSGLRFAVPQAWRSVSTNWWGGCPYNLGADILMLSTGQVLSDPGCPFPRATAAATAGVAGMVVGAGPKVSEPRLRGMTCVTRNALRVCIDPPPLHGAFQNRGLQILTARVYLPGQRQPDVIEVGLYGTGRACAAIVDSMVAEH